MYSDEDLDSAINANILNQESVKNFRQFIAQQRHSALNDEEHFRLISGFNDVFVSVACLLFLFSLSWLGSQLNSMLSALLVMIGSWLLAKPFVIKRRLALPAIVLLFSYVGSFFWLSLILFTLIYEDAAALGAGIATLVGAYVHWRYFKVPITIAAGVACLVGSVISFISEFSTLKTFMPAVFFMGGLFCFMYAMWWDSQDRHRQTRKSDVGFWLHLLAAPLIVHPIFTSIGIFDTNSNLLQISLVLLLYASLAIVSLIVDRRALMLSALFYALYALTHMLKTYGSLDQGFALAGLMIGGALLILSVFWHSTRALLIRHLPIAYQHKLPTVQ